MERRLTIRLDEDMHEDLRELAFRKKASMAVLVRYALDKTFEDAFDVIGAERALEDAARDPSSSMSWEEYKRLRGDAALG
jgi:predicted DNA-binding protein